MVRAVHCTVTRVGRLGMVLWIRGYKANLDDVNDWVRPSFTSSKLALYPLTHHPNTGNCRLSPPRRTPPGVSQLLRTLSL